MLDQRSQPLWQSELPGNPPPVPGVDDHNEARPVIADVDGDGSKELLYAFRDTDQAAPPDTLYCFNVDGRVR